MSISGQVNHRLHLLRASYDAESGESDLRLELLSSHNLRDYLTFTEVSGPMKEAQDLITALENDDNEKEEEDSVDVASLMRNAESKGTSAAEKTNQNDVSLYSRKLSFTWVPATRNLASVQWGEVWYWSSKTSGNNQGLTLANQDSHDLRVRTNEMTLVVSSPTNVTLPPLKRVSNLQLEASKTPLPSEVSGSESHYSKNLGCGLKCDFLHQERNLLPDSLKWSQDDLVVVVCGAAPAKLLRVDGTGNLISTIECQLEDEELRARVSFACACICANHVLLGGSDGAVYVVDTNTFEFVDRLTIPFPSRHRGKLDLRANMLNKIRLQSLSKKKSTLTSEKAKRQQKTDQRRRLKQLEKNKVKFFNCADRSHSPCVWLGITGPQLTSRGRSPKIIAEYADGTVCLHSPQFSFDPKKQDEGDAGQAKTENEDEEVVKMTHNGVGAVYATAFASPKQSSRILKLGAVIGDGGERQEGGVLLFTGGSDQSVHLWRVPDR